MPEINNAQLTEFCNDDLRKIADALARADMLLPGLRATYDQRGLGSIIDAAGSSNLVTDGSAVDGRTRVTGGDVYNLVTLIDDLRTFFTASGRRDVLAKWQVNGLR